MEDINVEDINGEFGQADVVLVQGANDVVNPASKDPKSSIAGMPILEVYKAKTVIVNKHRQQTLDGRRLCRSR